MDAPNDYPAHRGPRNGRSYATELDTDLPRDLCGQTRATCGSHNFHQHVTCGVSERSLMVSAIGTLPLPGRPHCRLSKAHAEQGRLNGLLGLVFVNT